MKCFRLLALALLIVFSACARDNDSSSNQTVAKVPEYQPGTYGYGSYCLRNGGYGCSYNGYPSGFSGYPTYSNGYYYGYNSGSYYYNTNYYSACPYGTVAAYSPYYGLGCVQTNGYQANYYYASSQSYYYYSYGGYNALVYCTVSSASVCPSGTACVAYTYGAAYGFCRY
jgi:hypothetical protein